MSTALLRQLPRTLARTTGAPRANFSLVARARQLARGFEPHPFARVPVTQNAAPADYSRLVKHLGNAAVIYFPWMGFVLGWPLACEYVLDGTLV